MSFSSFSEFLAMGKHGLYVWSAFGVTLLVLLINLWWPWQARRRHLQQEARRMRREAQA